MRSRRLAKAILTGCLVFGGSTMSVYAAPSIADMLRFKPRQQGVNYTTPKDEAGCKVELVTGTKPGSNGWMLKDATGQSLRRFFDSNGDKKVDMWSYYQDGVEVYREIDTNLNDKADQYRWINTGGSKWGVDTNEEGRIDTWKVISAEEVSQEVFLALQSRDFKRLEALWITDTDVRALQISSNELNRLRTLKTQAQTKFQATIAKLNLDSGAHWVRLDADMPQCLPADQSGMGTDVIRHQRATILYENKGKHDWILIGEMMYVNGAWRIVDAPSTGDATQDGPKESTTVDPAVKGLVDQLRALDEKAPKSDVVGANTELVRYQLGRADLLEKIVTKVKTDEREQWVRQLAECLGAAAQAADKDKGPYERLTRLAQQVAREQPGSNTAAYVTFREMQADYSTRLAHATAADFQNIQNGWLERLAKFVEIYPRSDDTADALLQLGMVSEFVNKETEAKKWYGQLMTNFPGHTLAKKAQGAKTRLELDGKPFELNGPTLGGGSYELARARGKVVIVYYWASWNQQCVGDFARLKLLLSTYGAKGVELVCVNLDAAPPEMDFLSRVQPPGTQLFQPGGLESPLAQQYGIMVLPNLFLVGKDGKCVSRTVQMGTLEDEIKKLLN